MSMEFLLPPIAPPPDEDLTEYGAIRPDDHPGYDRLTYDGFWFDFEKNFDVRPTTWFLHTYYWHSVIGISIVYLSMITIGQRIMKNRQAFELRTPLMLWNYALAIFSIFGAWRQSTELWFVYRERGFMGATCTVSIAYSIAAYWAEKFAYSKVLELGDTLFLVLRKRPITFLHWYHHVTVLAYTWHAVKDHTVAGRWFIWMNYSVHAIMYTYYALMSSGRWRAPKIVSASITTLQITQMFVGMFIAWFVYQQKISDTQYCHQTWTNIYGSSLMYASYMALFLRYFYLAYLSPKPRSSKPAVDSKRYSKAVGEQNGYASLTPSRNGKAHAD